MTVDLLGAEASRSSDPAPQKKSRIRLAICLFAVVAVASAALAAQTLSALQHRDPDLNTDGTPAQDMASVLPQTVAKALSQYVNLPQPQLGAGDQEFNQLPASAYAEAANMSVTYAQPDGLQQIRVYTGRTPDAPSASDPCPKEIGASLVSCDVVSKDDNAYSVALVVVAIDRGRSTTPMWEEVDGWTLSKSDLSSVRIERDVTTYWGDGRIVDADEQVFAPNSLDPDQVFDVPTAALTELTRDPELLMR